MKYTPIYRGEFLCVSIFHFSECPLSIDHLHNDSSLSEKFTDGTDECINIYFSIINSD